MNADFNEFHHVVRMGKILSSVNEVCLQVFFNGLLCVKAGCVQRTCFKRRFMARRSLSALRSHPRARSTLSLIQNSPLSESGRDECLRDVAPLFDFLRRVNDEFNFYRKIGQRPV